ncbi:TPA: hypothetical protein WI134_000468 [Neisseria meningitidis]
MLSLEIQQEGFTIGGGLVLGGCAGAHLARKEPLILTGKTGAGAQALDINGLSICQSQKKELNNNAFPLYIWYFDDFICFRNVI